MSSAQLTLELLLPEFVPPAVHAWTAAAPGLPALQRILARAHKSVSRCDHLAALLLTGFGVQRQSDWPAAPFSLLGEGLDPGPDPWLLAEPAHLVARQSSLALTDPRQLRLSQQESEALLTTVNRHFAHDGLVFCAPQPRRWYLRLPRDLRAGTTPPELARGHDIEPFLPRGADALLLHRWVNEIQMLLHEHPVNTAREGRGEPAVNTLWTWGAGRLVAPAATASSWIWTEDALLRGLARASGLPLHAPPAHAAAWLALARPGAHRILLDAPGHGQDWSARAQALERDWFGPLLTALSTGRLHGLALVTWDRGQGLRFEVAPGDLWKVWRRSRGLVHE